MRKMAVEMAHVFCEMWIGIECSASTLQSSAATAIINHCSCVQISLYILKESLLLSGHVLKVCLSGRGRMLHVLSANERQVLFLCMLTIYMVSSEVAVVPPTDVLHLFKILVTVIIESCR